MLPNAWQTRPGSPPRSCASRPDKSALPRILGAGWPNNSLPARAQPPAGKGFRGYHHLSNRLRSALEELLGPGTEFGKRRAASWCDDATDASCRGVLPGSLHGEDRFLTWSTIPGTLSSEPISHTRQRQLRAECCAAAPPWSRVATERSRSQLASPFQRGTFVIARTASCFGLCVFCGLTS